MLEAAPASDGEVARMLTEWKDQRARIIHDAVRGLAPALRPGLSWEEAAAIVRALSAPELYSELVRGEGWTPDRYEEWLVRLMTTELVAGAGARGVHDEPSTS
jgi:hypothetical protein